VKREVFVWLRYKFGSQLAFLRIDQTLGQGLHQNDPAGLLGKRGAMKPTALIL